MSQSAKAEAGTSQTPARTEQTVRVAGDALPPPELRGKTYIADEVVSVIARRAAEGVPGIHRIGESTFRSLFGRLGRHHGVESEVGMRQAAVDVDIVVEFGYPIKDVAQELRRSVIEAVEQMTGRQVIEVNIRVGDVHVPEQDRTKRAERELL